MKGRFLSWFSIAILWFLTVAALLTPHITYSETISIDVSADNIYKETSRTTRHLAPWRPMEKTYNSRMGHSFSISEISGIPTVHHERQLNHFSSGSTSPIPSIGSMKLRRAAKLGYLSSFRRHIKNKRIRYSGSGDGEVTATDMLATSEFVTTKMPTTTSRKEKQRTTTTTTPTEKGSTTTLASTSGKTGRTPSSVPTKRKNAGKNDTEEDRSTISGNLTESFQTITTINDTADATTTASATTSQDPCQEVSDMAPTTLRFPPGKLRAHSFNARISMDDSKTVLKPWYNFSIYHEKDWIASKIQESKIASFTDLLPCTQYEVCAFTLVLGCGRNPSICNETTTSPNISEINITHHVVNSGASETTLSISRSATACKLNYRIAVGGDVWKFDTENTAEPISSKSANSTSSIQCAYFNNLTTNGISFKLTGLSPFTDYQIKVWAESGTSKTKTHQILFKTEPSKPTQVRNANATCSEKSVTISWTQPETFNGHFELYKLIYNICLSNDTKCKRHELTLNDSNYTISVPKLGSLYKFAIQAKTKDVTDYGDVDNSVCQTPPEVIPPEAPENLVLVVTWIFTCILFLVLLGFLLVALQRKKIIHLPFIYKLCPSGRSSRDSRQVAIPFRVTSKPVRLVDFEEHYLTMTSDSSFKFSQEFEELVGGSPLCPATAAQMSENQSKNRWVNILPFDHSRVKLLPIADDVFTDYINASYIPGYKSQREFIASQGPLPNTKDDFWRMVWEQNSPMIVMVTQCTERGKEKCEQYWPQDREIHHYGDLAVKLKSESILTGYSLRIFDLHLGSRTMEVKQMHFTMWPDFGCPANTSLLINFVGSVRDHMPHESTGPIIVHCSAGVGRTGTFIAVDKLMQHIEDHEFVDVYGTVREMRKYRTNMVQTEDQYMYIHECVKDLLIDMQTRTPIEKNMGESMVDIIVMAQSDTPSKKRRSECFGGNGSDPECFGGNGSDPDTTETAALLSVTTEASDLTVFTELADTASMVSEYSISELQPNDNADETNDEVVLRKTCQSRLSSTNRLSHDPQHAFLRFSKGGEPLGVHPNDSTQPSDATDIPESDFTQACPTPQSDSWYI